MANCAKCQAKVIAIRMRIAGRNVVFHSCAACECKTWQDASGAMPLARVLELARGGS